MAIGSTIISSEGNSMLPSVNRRNFLKTSAITISSLQPTLMKAKNPKITVAQNPSNQKSRLKTGSSGGIFIHPWDITDEGIDNCYDFLGDHCGLNEIRAAAIYHACTFLLPHNPKRMVRWDEGSAFFIPQHPRWRETRIRPVVGTCVDTPGYMHRIVDKARKRNWGMIFFTVFHFNHSMARAYPETCMVDVMGERHGSYLCPANPDVRSHDLAVVEELMDTYGGDGIRYEHLGYGGLNWWSFTLNKIEVPPSPRDKFLLDLCFCASCCHRALMQNIDVYSFRRNVKDHLYHSLPKLPAEWDKGKVDEEWCQNAFGGKLWEYMEMRFNTVTSLFWSVQEIVNRFGGGLMPFRVPYELKKNRFGQSFMNKIDYSKFYPYLKRGGVNPLGKTKDAQQRSLVKQVSQVPEWSEPETMHIQHQYNSKEPLLEKIKMSRNAGIRHHFFHYYGQSRREQLKWIGEGREAWA